MIELCPVGRAATPDEVGHVGALLMGEDGAFTSWMAVSPLPTGTANRPRSDKNNQAHDNEKAYTRKERTGALGHRPRLHEDQPVLWRAAAAARRGEADPRRGRPRHHVLRYGSARRWKDRSGGSEPTGSTSTKARQGSHSTLDVRGGLGTRTLRALESSKAASSTGPNCTPAHPQGRAASRA